MSAKQTRDDEVREIHLAMLDAGHGAFGCVSCHRIAAAIEQAEARGRSETLALCERERAETIAQARDAGLEEAAKIAEGGAFLVDDSPEAHFGKSMAAAIRRAMKRGGRE